MEFTTIYRNGKPERFFIKVSDIKEYAFIQPYFLATSIDHARHGSILEMECLFSGSVWQGRQRHGYGYSCSADVYGELIRIIKKIHKSRLTPSDRETLSKINTHDSDLTLPENFLENLKEYNSVAMAEKYGW